MYHTQVFEHRSLPRVTSIKLLHSMIDILWCTQKYITRDENLLSGSNPTTHRLSVPGSPPYRFHLFHPARHSMNLTPLHSVNFRWMDTLGMSASNNVTLIARQTFGSLVGDGATPKPVSRFVLGFKEK